MPTRESDFSRYKIPADLAPVGVCCVCVPVPDDVEYKAQFLGALWRMSLQTHYRRDAAHSGAVVAAIWRDVWTEVTADMSCCGDTLAKNNENNYNLYINTKLVMLQLYQMYVAASLDVSVAFPDVPDDYDADPGDSPGEANQRDLALCIACKSWVDSTLNMGMSFLERAVVDVLPIAVGVVAIPIIPFPVSVFIGVLAAAYTSVGYLQMANEDYRDYLACGMYEALKGEQTATRVGFDAAFDNLPVRPPPAQTGAEDIARDIIEKWLRAVVNDLENWLGFVSNLGAAMSAARELAGEDCGCYECATEIYDFEATAHHPPVHVGVDAHPPVFTPPNLDGEGGLWKAGVGQTGDGIESQVTGVSNFLNCSIRIELNEFCPVTRVEHYAKYSNAGGNRWRLTQFFDAAGVLVHSAFANTISVTGNWDPRSTGAINVSGAKWLWILEESTTVLDTFCWVDDISVEYG